jgi:hypothetical protein
MLIIGLGVTEALLATEPVSRFGAGVRALDLADAIDEPRREPASRPRSPAV